MADGVSVTGTTVSTVVLPLVVYHETGSSAATGGLFALRVIPYILFGAVAGPVADRWNRRRLIIGGHIIEGILGATIPVAALLGVLTVAQVYVVGLLSATAFVFSDAAVFGAVPALVGTERLAAANGFLATIISAAEVAGPAIGGLLAATIGATNAVWFDWATFFFAAAVQATIRSTFRVGEPPTGRCASASRSAGRCGSCVATALWRRCCWPGSATHSGSVRCSGCWCRTGRAARPAGEGSADRAALHGDRCWRADRRAVVRSVFAADRVKRITPISTAITAGITVGLVFSTWWVPAIVLLVLFQWAVGTTITTGITYRQLAAPDDLRSSVNVFGRMISWGGQPFGAGIGAVISSALDVRARTSSPRSR